jgi:hypothetical protein
MKKSMISMVFSLAIVAGLVFPTASAAGTPLLTWNCAVGDSLDYTIENTLAEMIANDIPDDVWAEANATLEMLDSEYTDAKALMSEILPILLPPQFGVSFEITAIEGEVDEDEEDPLLGIDTIMAKFLMRHNENEPFVDPETYANDTFDDLVPYLTEAIRVQAAMYGQNVTDDEVDAMIEEIKADMTADMGPNEAFPLAQWAKLNQTLFEMMMMPTASMPGVKQEIPEEYEYEMSNEQAMMMAFLPLIVPFTALPVPMLPSSLMVLPAEWKWNEVKGLLEGLLGNNPAQNMTWNEFIAEFGLSQAIFNARSIALVIDIATAQESEYAASYVAQAAAGLNMTEGTITLGIEWSSKGLLTGFGLYIEGNAQVSSEDLLGMVMSMKATGPSIPSITTEAEMSFGVTMAAEGSVPPSKEQITSGVIGEERPGAYQEETNAGSDMQIPGYPLGILAVVGVFTIGMILKKKK